MTLAFCIDAKAGGAAPLARRRPPGGFCPRWAQVLTESVIFCTPQAGRRGRRPRTRGSAPLVGSGFQPAAGIRSGALAVFSAVSLLAASSDARLADAAKKMDRAAIRSLLERRVDVNAPQIDGTTALHWAANQDDVEAAQMLIHAGANVKAANRYDVTPLSLACTNGNGAMVALLLKAGADPNTTLPSGETALMTAART